MAVSSNEINMQNWVKTFMWGSRDPIFELWDNLISRTVEARDVKFGT